MDRAELSIGELAARSGLSPKALRLYDESELLVPQRVDAFTGYRYYGDEQVARARLIAALRGVGMGLSRIRVLCDLHPSAAAAELRSWWRQEEADLLSRAESVHALVRDLGETSEEDIVTASSTTVRTAQALRQGNRGVQQDAALVRLLPGGRTLLGVADGFRGAGDLAQHVLAAIAGALDRGRNLEEAWRAAEDLIPHSSPAGTTLTLALLDGDRLEVSHIGDSRVILVRGGRIASLTHDHTHVRSLVEAGRLSPEEAATHPDARVLNRALVAGAPSAPDLLQRRLEPGDLLVLATDGLHVPVPAADLAELLTEGPSDPQELADQLLHLVSAAGGEDDVAVALARV